MEALSAVFDEGFEDDERTLLTVDVGILELLAQRSAGLGGTGGLQIDGFDEFGDAIVLLLCVPLCAETIDPVGDRGEGLAVAQVALRLTREFLAGANKKMCGWRAVNLDVTTVIRRLARETYLEHGEMI